MKTQYLILEFPNGDIAIGLITACPYTAEDFKKATWEVSECIDVNEDTPFKVVMSHVMYTAKGTEH